MVSGPGARDAGLAAGIAILVGGIASIGLSRWPAVYFDEPLYADPGRQFGLHGDLASPLMAAIMPGAGTHAYWEWPLYLVAMGSVVRVLGFGLVQARLLSVVALGVSAALVFLLARRWTSRGLAAGTALVASMPTWVLFSGRIIRPEAFTEALVLGSFLAYTRGRDGGRWAQVAAGLLAGGALLSHPLGVIASAAIGADIMLRRHRDGLRPAEAARLGLPLLAVLLGWGIFALQDPANFLLQQSVQFGVKSSRGLQQLGVIANLFRGHPATLVVLGAGAVLALGHLGRADPGRPLAALALVSTAAAVLGREAIYLVYPVAPLLLAFVVFTRPSRRRWLPLAALVLVVANEGLATQHRVSTTTAPPLESRVSALTAVVGAGRAVFIGPGGELGYFALVARDSLTGNLLGEVANDRRAAAGAEYIISGVYPADDPSQPLASLVAGRRLVVVIDAGGGEQVRVSARDDVH